MALTQVPASMQAADAQYTGFKNRIINGAMVIDQRNAGGIVGATNGGYNIDRWLCNSYDSGAVTGKFTVQQNSGNAPLAQGFNQCVKITSSAATTVNSNAVYTIKQVIEGNNISDLAWGTSSAKTVTLSFWVYSSLTGTFGGALQNGSSSYNYPYQYTISIANTWTYITVNVAGPTSGTWTTDNGGGLIVTFGLGAGASWTQPANSWTASTAYSANGCVNVVGTSGATFYLTGVQLEKGSVATAFDYRSYGQELALCQRYFQLAAKGTMGANYGATAAILAWPFPVQMRANPSSGLLTGSTSQIDIIGGSQAGTIAGNGSNGSPLCFSSTISGLSGRTAGVPVIYQDTNLYFTAEL